MKRKEPRRRLLAGLFFAQLSGVGERGDGRVENVGINTFLLELLRNLV